MKTAFVGQVLVPELLYAAEAKQRGLERDPGIVARHDQMLARSVEEQIRDAARTPGPTDAEIQGYYDAHSKQYNSPIRIRVWRIVVADEASAKAILDQVKGQGQAGVTKWKQLAREKSLDTATAMRDGDVGLVYPDGATESGRVKVDPKLFAAASQVKDGELGAAPVKIDAGWAVLWQQGSLPAVRRTLANEKVTIARQLERERAGERAARAPRAPAQWQREGPPPELLQSIAVSTFGTVGTPGRPGGLPGRVPDRVPDRHPPARRRGRPVASYATRLGAGVRDLTRFRRARPPVPRGVGRQPRAGACAPPESPAGSSPCQLPCGPGARTPPASSRSRIDQHQVILVGTRLNQPL